LAEINIDGTKVVASNGLRAAFSIAGLLSSYQRLLPGEDCTPYRMHLDSHRGAGLDGALARNTSGTANIAAYVVAADVGDRVVVRGHPDTLGAVHCKSASFTVTVIW